MYLFNRDYIPACEMDVCRATDGINLRYRFASENDIPYGKIDAVFQGVPCSMLEMMVALAIRIEEHIMEDRSMGNRVGQWFFQRRARGTDPGPVYGSGLPAERSWRSLYAEPSDHRHAHH